MKIIKLAKFKLDKNYTKIMKRSGEQYSGLFDTVKNIFNEVCQRGDIAVKEYTKQFDSVDLKNFKVSKQEIQEAYTKVDANYVKALEQSINNITLVCKQQIRDIKNTVIETQPGVRVWQKWNPIEKVGLYVPGGRALYPSSVLMNAIPAKVAGCKQISLTTPPQKNGNIAPEILVAADRLGINKIFKIGGAQAIASLVYGTETVPKVYKIVGPGNAYVATAKLYGLMSGEISIDSPAGPSEVFIIADETADPKFIAADLMADAEHGPDGASILISTSKKLIEKVVEEIENKAKQFKTQNNITNSIENYGLFAIAKSTDEAIAFANEYAPEHIQIMTKNALIVADKIYNAGSVFVGNYTCKSAGDYASGANHVLPTGGSAKTFSGLSVFDFMKRIEYQQCSKQGLDRLRNTINTFADVEGLPAHKYSCGVRFNNNKTYEKFS